MVELVAINKQTNYVIAMTDDQKAAKAAYQREYRAKNKERLRKRDAEKYKAYYQKNRERLIARQVEYQRENREAVKARMDEWRQRPGVKDRINESQRKRYLPRLYGITVEDRDRMLAEQGGCAVCKSPEPRNRWGWVVDHCHSTGKVRGILCQPCNLAAGKMLDDVERIRALADYIERHK